MGCGGDPSALGTAWLPLLVASASWLTAVPHAEQSELRSMTIKAFHNLALAPVWSAPLPVPVLRWDLPPAGASAEARLGRHACPPLCSHHSARPSITISSKAPPACAAPQSELGTGALTSKRFLAPAGRLLDLTCQPGTSAT